MTGKKSFTLIELLVAITIFSVIAVSVYAVFSSGVRLWYKTSPLVQANQSARYFFNTISSDLKNSVAYFTKEANFEGGPQTISFMTVINCSGQDRTSSGEVARVTYSYDRSAKAVIRSVATKEEGLDPDRAKPSAILEGVEQKEFGFEFCYKRISSPTDYDYEWKDEWADEDKKSGKIPRGVKVKASGYEKTIFIPTGYLGGKDEAAK